jgi:dienelactone hydrolase
MNSRRKSTDSRKLPEDPRWGEDVARLHCLQALFPHWAENDGFYLKQIKESIDATLEDEGIENTFENFSKQAESLNQQTPGIIPASHAFISVDFSNRTWEPLFARQEIIAHLKSHAGTEHIFLLIRGLRRALFPNAQYRTKARDQAYTDATDFIDELSLQWSTRSSKVHLLYI